MYIIANGLFPSLLHPRFTFYKYSPLKLAFFNIPVSRPLISRFPVSIVFLFPTLICYVPVSPSNILFPSVPVPWDGIIIGLAVFLLILALVMMVFGLYLYLKWVSCWVACGLFCIDHWLLTVFTFRLFTTVWYWQLTWASTLIFDRRRKRRKRQIYHTEDGTFLR